MTVLGISSFYHDSAAALIIDGKVVTGILEERLTRTKHDHSFPAKAVSYCLKENGISIKKIDLITYYEKPLVKFDRIMRQYVQYFPKTNQVFNDTFAKVKTTNLDIEDIIRNTLRYKGEIWYLPHHLSHAAFAYYSSPFSESTVITLDGVGEKATTTVAVAKGPDINLKSQIEFPHSLGLLYSAGTAFLGFTVNEDEYKVMGLAAYGSPNFYLKKFTKLVNLHSDGSFSLNLKYFNYIWGNQMFSADFVNLFALEPRQPNAPITKNHQDFAAGLQELTERVASHVINHALVKYPSRNVCFGGGVFLNSVLNGKLHKSLKQNIHIPFDPGDGGSAIGCGLYGYHKKTGQKFTPKHISPYLGPEYSSNQILQSIKKLKFSNYKKHTRKDLLGKTADLLKNNKVIGWYQGRMEWGPRALGNRSIIAPATQPEMQDILNAKVKKREEFRPFAPAILAEHVETYFDTSKKKLPKSADYMSLVLPVKKAVRNKVPAIVHVNQTGRLQQLVRADNPLFYDLIDTYYQQTSIPLIINTSFNVKGEPIVCTPKEALNCFFTTDIDILVMGNYLLEK